MLSAKVATLFLILLRREFDLLWTLLGCFSPDILSSHQRFNLELECQKNGVLFSVVQSGILDRFPDEEGKAKVVTLCCQSASLVSHFFPFGLKFSVEQVRLVQRFPTMFREL